ncbi:IAA-alanine resistance protein 1 [Camellia lanceoleosa]|uniref:IAA-alanine resistance protein 1 n=1 Tax=Camellia lanceoleosa TaxID=1840588 RepID=A0ACC0IN36_9ERIC|nr:IAA-alanine resistance protein 1 [Camellia lanceoleosa]
MVFRERESGRRGAGMFLLDLAFLGLYLLVVALGEVVALLLELPFRAEARARKWLAIDEAEGGVVVGSGAAAEGIIAGEIEDGVGEMGGVAGRVVVAVLNCCRSGCLFREIAYVACLRNGEAATYENRQRELADVLRDQAVDELLTRRKETECKKLKDDNDDDDKIQQQFLNEKNESVSEMSSQGKVLDKGSEKQNQPESLWKHNFTDGIALGSAFLLYGSVGGWSTTLFLLAHELPQENELELCFENSLFQFPLSTGDTSKSNIVMGQDQGQSSLIEDSREAGSCTLQWPKCWQK